METGAWLKGNGEAIYEITYWEKQEGETTDGKEVRFTKRDTNLYAIIMEEEVSKTVKIKDLEIPENGVLTLLGAEGVLDWKQSGENLVVELLENFTKQYAYMIKIAG